MKPLLGTLYVLGMLVHGGLGCDRSLAQNRQEVVGKTVTSRRNLETYSYNKYHPMGEIYQWMSQISEKYPEGVTQHFLGMTYETQPMYYLKILQNYTDNSSISRLLKNLDFFVLPVLNIDGYIYTWTTIQAGDKAANALKAKHGTNYRVGSSIDILYASSGSSRDWARDIGIPFSYTFELRDNGTYGFELPEAQIQATSEETMEAVLSVLDDVYEKYWYSNSAEKVTSTSVMLSLLMSFMSLL